MSRAFLDGLLAGAALGVAVLVWLDVWRQRREVADAERRVARLEQEAREALRPKPEVILFFDKDGNLVGRRVVHVPELSDLDRRPR